MTQEVLDKANGLMARIVQLESRKSTLASVGSDKTMVVTFNGIGTVRVDGDLATDVFDVISAGIDSTLAEVRVEFDELTTDDAPNGNNDPSGNTDPSGNND